MARTALIWFRIGFGWEPSASASHTGCTCSLECFLLARADPPGGRPLYVADIQPINRAMRIATLASSLLIAIAMTMVPPATALGRVLLVDSAGQPVGGKWQAWADAARVPTVSGALLFSTDPTSCQGASGCSDGPPMYGPVAHTFMAPGATRHALYFELGHQFDWNVLTDADRQYLARVWLVPHANWWDSAESLGQANEDGLEAAFAGIYADCALGENDQGFAIVAGVGPVVAPQIDTCRFITRVAHQGALVAAPHPRRHSWRAPAHADAVSSPSRRDHGGRMRRVAAGRSH